MCRWLGPRVCVVLAGLVKGAASVQLLFQEWLQPERSTRVLSDCAVADEAFDVDPEVKTTQRQG